jgi:hypothetical protein
VSNRGKHRRSNRKRPAIMAATAAATALVGGLMAPAAQAWDNDPHVTVKGGAGCKQLFHKATAVQFLLSNGEFAESPIVQGSYKVDFYAIPGSTVTNADGLNGVPGYAAVKCTSVLNPSSSYVWYRGVSVQRPRIGVIQSTNLGGG